MDNDTEEIAPITYDSHTMRFQLNWPFVDGVDEQPDPLVVYLVVGVNEDGRPRSMFFHGSELGELSHGMLAALAMSASVGLRHGVPIETTIRQWRATRFPPEGFTGDPDFPKCTSILDAFGQWLHAKFVKHD